ncbi:alpha-N-acetylgalactosaminide alpha-2,6-sialyltransferase 2 [Trichomycterus rosablanca]|uniref:alpha-N-acetylgalactosaminide alpha-2,6-sialyltransferase 2 n=1 Tax=Trichomycterus rosablanca TaxID=2290929 RepID=UPI002F35BCD2
MAVIHQKKLLLSCMIVVTVIVVYLSLKLNGGGKLIRIQCSKDYYNHISCLLSGKGTEETRTLNSIATTLAIRNGKPVMVTDTNKSTKKPPPPAKPTEPDFIGDNYVIDYVPPQTICPNSIRNKVNQTDLAKTFLWNVPVLQWAKHFSLQEYKRLSHFPGAHGWGGVSIDVLNSSLSILNTSANRLMFEDWKEKNMGSGCIHCAVVGNGGILNGSKKGQEIDEHDYVFRTNGAVIEGFEKDVGKRTSFYLFSFNTFMNSRRSYRDVGYKGAPQSKETKFVFLPDHAKDYEIMMAEATHLGEKPTNYFGNNVTVKKFKMLHPDFIRYVRNRFLHSNILKTKHKNIYRPSTGGTMLMAALHTCDQVSAYGFMTPDFYKYSDHYFDKKHHKVGFYANHDLKLELKLWQELHKAKLLKLYMR